MHSVPDRAHRSEPRMNRVTAKMNTRRVPKRSASQPLTGMSMATVRV